MAPLDKDQGRSSRVDPANNTDFFCLEGFPLCEVEPNFHLVLRIRTKNLLKSCPEPIHLLLYLGRRRLPLTWARFMMPFAFGKREILSIFCVRFAQVQTHKYNVLEYALVTNSQTLTHVWVCQGPP